MVDVGVDGPLRRALRTRRASDFRPTGSLELWQPSNARGLGAPVPRATAGPRYVAPVLDPNWQSPYAPTQRREAREPEGRAQLRDAQEAPRDASASRVVVLVLIVGVIVAPWVPARRHRRGPALRVGPSPLARALRGARASPSGTSSSISSRPAGREKDRLRLATVMDRLAATFGVDAVNDLHRERPRLQRRAGADRSGTLVLRDRRVDARLRTHRTRGRRRALSRATPPRTARCARASPRSRSPTTTRVARSPARDWPTAPTRSPPPPSATRRVWPGRCASAPARTSRAPRSSPAPPTRSGAGSGSTSGATAHTTSSDLDDVELRARALEEW